MFNCILAGIAVLLLGGNGWLCMLAVIAMAAGAAYYRDYLPKTIKKQGGIKSVRVLDRVSYSKEGLRPKLSETQYTVLVRYGNGQNVRYKLSADSAMFKAIKPYIAES